MQKTTRMRAKRSGLLSEILVLLRHPMRAGRSAGDPGDCLEKLSIRRSGRAVADVFTGPNVAENPLFALAVEGLAKGEDLEACWRDSRGDRGKALLVVDQGKTKVARSTGNQF